jgi:transposase
MIRLAMGTRVYLACPVDMRKGFDGLAAHVTTTLRADPFSGHAFVFRSKRGDYLKMLYWDGSGLCLFAKRLEHGRYAFPPVIDDSFQMSPAQLALLIEGMDWRRTVSVDTLQRPATSEDIPINMRSNHSFGGLLLLSMNMTLDIAGLPSDPDALRAMAAVLQAENASLRDANTTLEARMTRELAARDTELYAKTLHIEKLKLQLAVLRRARFGRSSEKLDLAIEQMELVLGDLEAEQADKISPASRMGAEPALSATASSERVQPVRRALPPHLPRERVAHEPACVCSECGGANLTLIGTDEREVLEYVPSHFKVIVHARPKLSCRDCETISQPPMPWLPIERGLPGPGLLAHVLTAKYCDHLPLHRQSVIYARDGVELERSTLAGWVGQMAAMLDPLSEAIAMHVRQGEVLHADDTPVPVLDPGRGQTKTGRLWVAVRDERSWGSGVPPAVFYRYSPDRKAERAKALLKDCHGYLHADGYSGFNLIYKPNPITGRAHMTEVACWAHVRRKIYEVHSSTKSPAAQDLLERMRALFAIEAQIRGRPAEKRQAARAEHAMPLLDDLKAAMESAHARGSKKGGLGKGIRYALSRWNSLIRYVADGRLDMTNNAAERSMRPIAIGRKNWMFAGSDDGGRRAAAMYTLIETAKMNGLDPEAYLRAVIGRIAQHPINRIGDLLPWNIKL